MQAPIRFTYNYIPIHQQAAFQLFVLVLVVLFCLYIIALLKRRDSIESLFKISNSKRDGYSAQVGGATALRAPLVVMNQIIASGTFAAISMRIVGEQGWGDLVATQINYSQALLTITLFALPILLRLYQWGVTTLAGEISGFQSITKAITLTDLKSYTFGTLIITPILLLLLLSEVLTTQNMLNFVVILYSLVLLNDVFQTLRLFMSEKLSILDWILYLCTVKIIPLSFAWRFLTI